MITAGARLASVFVLLLAASLPASAQAPRATLEADVTEVSVGDRITAVLTIDHEPGLSPRWTDPVDLAPFEILGFEPSPPRVDGDRAVSVARLSLAVFELGELEIPSMDVVLTDAAGAETVATTDPFVVGVVSVGLDEGDDIRDVKGPLGIALNWVLLWPWLLLILAIVGLIYWLLKRRAGGEDASRPTAPPRPAHETALAALDDLERSTLLERGRVKDFHIAVSQIVREYIERRFGVDALEMTTGELMTPLEDEIEDEGLLSLTRRFLEACDLVKFAKARPDAPTSLARIPEARRFVEETIPPADPLEGGDPSDGGDPPEGDDPPEGADPREGDASPEESEAA